MFDSSDKHWCINFETLLEVDIFAGVKSVGNQTI